MGGWNVHQTTAMNLADPELELLDPTPNVHSMFLHFDQTFFWSKLSSRCIVRWSKRMFSCAGICTYEGRGGLCDIALSEPLLKLRPRKDLVQTLLHEMIHAFLFVTSRVLDRDGHGPNFQAHMHRINRAAGLNITIYHSFHDEVKLYQTHWWRCNGPCQLYRPHFGIVRRTNNRAPGPSDYWWEYHRRTCGGTFIKIREPDKPKTKGTKTNVAIPNADITKYFNNNNNNNTSNKNIMQNNKPVLKDARNILDNPKVGIKANNNSTLVVIKKNVTFNPQVPKSNPVVNSTKRTVGSKRPSDVLETVRNVWSNKKIGTNNIKQVSNDNNSTIPSNPNKHKPDYNPELPPPKVKKIDDYFKTTATSVLKDLYGQEFNVTKSDDQKLKAVPTITNHVVCPVCQSKIVCNINSDINRHLDECLNKDVIEKLSKENILDTPVLVENGEHMNNKNTAIFKEKDKKISNNVVNKPATNDDTIDLVNTEFVNEVNCKNERVKNDGNLRQSDTFKRPTTSDMVQKPPISVNPSLQTEPSCSYSDLKIEVVCPCCGETVKNSVDQHLDECVFFKTKHETPFKKDETIVILDDIDDEFDDSDEFNDTGTKLPCPCCLIMIEQRDMTQHLLECLD